MSTTSDAYTATPSAQDLADTLAALQAQLPTPATPAPTKPARPPRPRVTGVGAQNLSYQGDVAVKRPRPGTLRLSALELMEREEGATLEQVMEHVGWNRRQASDAVRLLGRDHGYCIEQDVDGTLRASTR